MHFSSFTDRQHRGQTASCMHASMPAACQQHASRISSINEVRTEVFDSSLSNRGTTFGNRHAALQATKANTHSSQGEVRSFCCTQCYSPAARYGPAPCHGPAPYIYMNSQGESQVYWYRSCW